MEKLYELHFHGNRQEIENEKQRKRELMSHFPKTLGTVDETRYVLHDDEKQKQTDYFESKPVSPLTVAPAKDEPLFNIRGIGEQQSEKPKKDVSMQTAVQGIAKFGNKETSFGLGNWKSASTLFSLQKEKNETKAPESPFDFDGNTAEEEDGPFNHGIQFPGLGAVGGKQPRKTTETNDSLGLESMEIENRLDSVLYNDKGHMSVTFRNDVIGIDGFKPFNPSDRTGCKRRCMEMLAHSGCELSGERIDMTVNNDNGRAIAQSADFQKGINAIDNALDKKQTIILNEYYKDGTASSADRAGDHFIIIVGRTIIDGIAYYHFYDPATSDLKRGTANRNVLQIKDGYLTGDFLTGRGKVKRYKVTSVRLNKKKQFKK
jgi:hypothetical protein